MLERDVFDGFFFFEGDVEKEFDTTDGLVEVAPGSFFYPDKVLLEGEYFLGCDFIWAFVVVSCQF